MSNLWIDEGFPVEIAIGRDKDGQPFTVEAPCEEVVLVRGRRQVDGAADAQALTRIMAGLEMSGHIQGLMNECVALRAALTDARSYWRRYSPRGNELLDGADTATAEGRAWRGAQDALASDVGVTLGAHVQQLEEVAFAAAAFVASLMVADAKLIEADAPPILRRLIAALAVIDAVPALGEGR